MTIVSPNTIDATYLQDGQAAGSITPAYMRLVNDSLSGVAGSIQTGSYTAALADRGTIIEFNSASAVTFTIPPHSSVPFDVGTLINIYQMGAGTVTISGGSGVIVRTASSLVMRAQYSIASVRQRATDEWVASGDLA